MKYNLILPLLIVLTSCGTTKPAVKIYCDLPEDSLIRCRIPISGPVDPTPKQIDLIDEYNAYAHLECLLRQWGIVEAYQACRANQ